jgi:hypothetical protein
MTTNRDIVTTPVENSENHMLKTQEENMLKMLKSLAHSLNRGHQNEFSFVCTFIFIRFQK